ncbi:hypothetical protein AB0N09_03765 [Streptomyces erythrochromogenes]|uniref:hypothetical protein n=1 Tax=Streptomyces erythrochromogenes TaxID=285574 RepID=UPI00342F737F
MRTALRASIATAVLAGALLAPVAGTAHAAAATTPTAAAVTGTAPDRYAGTPVLIDKGVVAVLRHGSEGPEAWIRAVSDGWKPGDDYMSRVLGTLDLQHPEAAVNGLELELTKSGKGHVLTVTKDGKATSYPLPRATTGPSDCVSEVKQVNLGAGLLVDLTMSPKGPKAFMHGDEPGSAWTQTLTRTNPQGSPDYFAHINDPSGAKPVFEWKTQGGQNVPSRFAAFPALPKGCTPEYPVTRETPAPKSEPSVTKPVTGANASTQTAGQTTVVPRGSVAAGAEVASEDTDDSTTVAAGAGLLAVCAMLGATFLRRRRSHG